MSYQALYRKFRPSTFEDVKGQDHIVTTLKNQIKANRVGHAYLFCGTRGTGKTTIAKILAKAVNCKHTIEGSPCNECSVCQSIQTQVSMNVMEIDAASNNGVDNIRDIIDAVQYSPTEGNYKVYIIDEVHMLSAGAFNALLKTLEEPPSYVIFILATTEAHKIPITILSRCQRYDFKRITIDTISKQMMDLMKKEKVEVEEKAIRYIAKTADGSMRDGLSLLDQCIAFYFGEVLTYDNVLEVLGAVDVEIFTQMLTHVLNSSVIGCIELIEQLMIGGRELNQFVIEFTWYLRNLLLIKTSHMAFDMIDLSSENLVLLREQAKLVDTDKLMRYIRVLSELSNQLKYATQKRVLAEITFIKLCKPQMEQNYDSILHRLSLLEEQLEKGTVINSSQITKKNSSIIPETEEQPLERMYPALSDDLQEIAKSWNTILTKVSAIIRTVLMNAKPSVSQDNTLVLIFTDIVEKDFIDSGTHLKEIQDVIEQQVQKKVIIESKLIKQNSKEDMMFPDLTKIIKMNIEYEE